MIPRPIGIFLLGLIGIIVLGASSPSTASACCNDFMQLNLRKDLVQYSNDYRVKLENLQKPDSTGYGQYTTAWLGFYLAECPPNHQTYQCQFSQVGLWTDGRGTRWFVYAEPGVQCLRGSQPDGLSCLGDWGDLVPINDWGYFEAVHYYWKDSFWIARVCNSSGGCQDVAKIFTTSTAVFAAWSTSEEVYSADPDPYLLVKYFHYHPQYMLWGTGFQEWPATGSSGEQNTIQMSPPSICPSHYGDIVNVGGDLRWWWTGWYGNTCTGILF